MVGRYAGEKRQDELIDACAKSRHAQEIQVILAGKGPLEKKIPPSGGEAPQSHRHGISTSRPACWRSSHGGSVRPHLRR